MTALIVAAALFMQNLDGTVIATALPAMGRDFHADPVRLNIALTSYLFAVALFVPASGWLADRYGARRVFTAAISIFTIGSVLCGQSVSVATLIAARLVQGAGGALMVPVGRLVLLRTVPQERIVSAMAWVTVPGLVGPVIGPPLGGMIATYGNWRWIFDLNIPIGVIGVVLALRYIRDIREVDVGKLDLWGLLLSGLTLAAVMAVLELVGHIHADPGWLVASLVVGVGCGIGYWRHARDQARPLLDFTLMRFPGFSISVISGSLFRIGVGGTPFLLPLMIQIGFGRSAAQSGLVTFMAAVGAIMSKTATEWTLRRFGFRRVLVVNAIGSAFGLALYAAFRPGWPLAAIYLVLFVTGFFRSLQFTGYNAIAYADVPRERLSAATTLYAALQQVSLTVGIPISAFVLNALRGNAAPALGDFSAAFLVLAGLSILAAPAAMFLPKRTGDAMAGRVRG